MGKFCVKCGKVMKNTKLSHCSDECLLSDIKNSKSIDPEHQGAEHWKEGTDPWE